MKATLYLDGKGGYLNSAANDNNHYGYWDRINYASTETRGWLKKQRHISDQAKLFLMASDTRPRLIIDDDAIIMCLRGINLNKNEAPEDMISLRIWRNESCILTSSNRGSQSIANVENRLASGKGAKSLDQLLLALIDELANLTDGFIDKLEALIDGEEDKIANSTFEAFNPKMSLLRRQVATIRRYLSPQKEALEKLYRSKRSYLSDDFYDQLYVQIDKFIHMLENLDLIRERILVLQEQFNAFISHKQNSRLYLLAIISAIFLPLTFLSGLLGMNVGGLPGTANEYSFWVVSGFCVVVAVILLLWFKKSHWF